MLPLAAAAPKGANATAAATTNVSTRWATAKIELRIDPMSMPHMRFTSSECL